MPQPPAPLRRKDIEDINMYSIHSHLTYETKRNLTREILNRMRAEPGVTVVSITSGETRKIQKTAFTLVGLKIKFIPESHKTMEDFLFDLRKKTAAIKGVASLKYVSGPEKIT